MPRGSSPLRDRAPGDGHGDGGDRIGIGAGPIPDPLRRRWAWRCIAPIPLIITQAQRTLLRERGCSDEAIRTMTPAQAHEVLGLR